MLAGCGEGRQAQAPEQGPPPSVVVVEAAKQPVTESAEFVGRVVATERVDLRARVKGFLKERRFAEGQEVEAGDVLFAIEPDQYQAIVQQREADVAKAVADEENARAQLARGEELLKSNNIPRARVDELRAAALVAKASIAQAEAALAAARLDLGYTEITAPISGRIGLAAVTPGNLVGPESGVLATIVKPDPVYVEFPVTQRQLLDHRRRTAEKGGDAARVVVRVRLADGSLYPHPGRVDFVDVLVDPGTDSVTLRAEFPNPDGLLVEGQYAGVVVEAGEPEMAIVVPQSALQVDQQGTAVLVVDGDGKVQVRRIVTAKAPGAGVAVREGLAEGDLVITQGGQKVRPGQAVTAAPAQAPEGVKAP